MNDDDEEEKMMDIYDKKNKTNERFESKIKQTCKDMGIECEWQQDELYGIIPFLDIEVGTACTLNCKYCNEFMQDLRKKGKSLLFDMDKVLSDVNKLLMLVDRILVVSIIGGEPFLHPDLDLLIDLLDQSEKVFEIRIITNATIFPQGKILESIKKSSKMRMHISDYNSVAVQEKTELINWCKEYGIDLVMFHGGYEWFDMGEVYDRHLSMEDLRRSFETCYCNWCAGLYQGRIYRCGQIWVTQELTDYKPLEEEIIDINEISTKEQMKERIREFYSLSMMYACNYCEPTEKRKVVLAGEQL